MRSTNQRAPVNWSGWLIWASRVKVYSYAKLARTVARIRSCPASTGTDPELITASGKALRVLRATGTCTYSSLSDINPRTLPCNASAATRALLAASSTASRSARSFAGPSLFKVNEMEWTVLAPAASAASRTDDVRSSLSMVIVIVFDDRYPTGFADFGCGCGCACTCGKTGARLMPVVWI